jgi:hypothetical protein
MESKQSESKQSESKPTQASISTEIDQQIQALIDGAPNDGKTPAAVEAIAPALKLIAGQLKHTEYYILQNLAQQWVMSTISNRTQPKKTKTVIHAFPTLQDVALGPYSLRDPQLMAVPLPVTHILFQLAAMAKVDSLIFFEVPGNARVATEITRDNFQALLQMHLKNQQQPVPPTDIA